MSELDNEYDTTLAKISNPFRDYITCVKLPEFSGWQCVHGGFYAYTDDYNYKTHEFHTHQSRRKIITTAWIPSFLRKTVFEWQYPGHILHEE